jgi:hypothetical protein
MVTLPNATRNDLEAKLSPENFTRYAEVSTKKLDIQILNFQAVLPSPRIAKDSTIFSYCDKTRLGLFWFLDLWN